jgi:hypothetical protein
MLSAITVLVICLSCVSAKDYISFITDDGNRAIAHDQSYSTVSLQPYNPLDTSQKWIVSTSASGRSQVCAMSNTNIVWDVTILPGRQTPMSLREARPYSVTQWFVLRSHSSASLTIASHHVSHYHVTPAGGGLQLQQESRYQFKLERTNFRSMTN